ncbi:MAG: HD domain-containing protein, partial [Oscillospiraceae bacterium]
HIEDEDVLRAIRYHTTGRAGMSALEKVIYLADLTSSDREYNDVDKIRQISEQSLNRGMKFAMNCLVCDLVKRNRSLHQDT